MDRIKWIRALSVFVCVALLLAGIPSIAEFAAETAGEVVVSEATASAPDPTEVPPAITEAPTEAPTEVPTEAPTEEPAPVPTDVPTVDAPAETPEETPVPAETAAPTDALASVVSQWISAMNAQALTDDYQRALWLYGQLIANLAPGTADDALTALTKFSASSLGYALAYESLLHAAGFECVTVVGNDRAWNIVKIGDAWTHIDAFADDAPDSFGIHFGLTDAAMARDHAWNTAAVPACADTSVNYFVHERGYRSFVESADLSILLASAVEARAEKLFLYNAGAVPSIEDAVAVLLAEVDVSANVSEQGCFAAVQLRYPLIAEPTPEAPTPNENVQPIAIVPKVSALTLGVKETASVADWTMLPAGAEDDVKYISANSAIASVDAKGNVLAKKVGSTTITIMSESGQSGTVSVTVMKAPTAVAFVAERSIIGAGETLQLGYKLSSGAAGKVAFSIPASQKSIATITPDGLVTSYKAGKVSVTVRTYNGKKKTATLTVKPAPTTISLNKTSVVIGKGDAFTPVCTLSKGSASKISYSSTNSSVAPVDPATGKFTANSLGETVITAKTHNGLTAQINVKVVAAPTSVTLTAHHTALGVKEKVQLVPVFNEGSEIDTCSYTYSSSNTKVLSFNAAGLVGAVKAGSAVMTVSTYNGLKATLTFTIGKAPSSVAFVVDRAVLGVGETMQMGYKLSSGAAGGVTFSVPANQNIATITEDGLVTALNPGKVNVTVKTFNGKKKTGALTIKKAPTSIIVSNAPKALPEGTSMTLSATVNPDSAGKVYYKLADSASNVATVDENGKITALKQGSVRIIAYTYVEGVECPIDLEVTPAPKTLTLPETTIYLGVGESYQIKPKIDEGTSTIYSYATSNKKAVTVNQEGLIKGVKAGGAYITVKTHNNLSAKIAVYVKKAPTSVAFVADRAVLGVGETMQLGYKLSSGAVGKVTFSMPENQNVAKITEDGLITSLNPGKVNVTVATYNNKKKTGTITVMPAPTSIVMADVPQSIGVGGTIALNASVNSGSAGKITYTVEGDKNAVSIDANGKLKGLAPGKVRVTVSTYVPGLDKTFELEVKPVPTSISFDKTEYSVDVNGGTLQLMPTMLPAGSSAVLTYKIAKTGYFTIDANGVVTPIKKGSSKVTVTTHNGKTASTTVWVVDPYYPESAKFAETPPSYLNEGATYTPKITVFPETAIADLVWTSSNPGIASVDPSTGKVTALSYGRVTISAKSKRNSAISGSFSLVVLSSKRCLVMPTHRTDTSAINATLQQIRNVRQSAYTELNELVAKGWITSSEASTRKGYVDRAFEMYLFPWMTGSTVLYWKAANSEGGQKDFKPGIVYYGMPYTQSNRVNTPASAINAGYWKSSGKGYYVLQTNTFSSRNYPGSDCSSFVSMAIWGTGSSRRSDNTTKIANATYYKTLSGSYANDMRPGDILVKSGNHVVMFLYYANSDRSQIVVIEQGGGGDDLYSNCVSTSIRDVTYYSSRGYKLRRVNGLDMSYMK